MNNIKKDFHFICFSFNKVFSLIFYYGMLYGMFIIKRQVSLPVVVIGTGTQAREPAAAPSMLSLCRFE